MALLPSFPSTDVDAPQRAQARLVALRDAPGPAPGPGDPVTGHAAAVDAMPGAPHQASPDNENDLPTTSRGGRLVRWWVPGPLRDARWDPGRSGALILSLVAALAAVVAAVGVWRERPVPEPAPLLPVVTPAAARAPSAPPPPGAAHEVVVSVVGRVARPGLIRLPDGTRVADALAAAGGALPDTDLMGLNLAQRLSDGEQLLVGVAPPPGQPAGGVASGTPAATSRKVDLNAATLEQLDGLPGVGPVTAQRILDWRTANGRFTSVDQLREVSGIGQARLARLKDLVRV
ncbi:MAG: ComEA family DNA-binding protein [Actinomycetota bacterium]|nr:ComEA family DNA-binding protein [Actinomycetota bacterium]